MLMATLTCITVLIRISRTEEMLGECREGYCSSMMMVITVAFMYTLSASLQIAFLIASSIKREKI